MKLHPVKVHPSKALLAREDQLAWKIAGVAADSAASTIVEQVANGVSVRMAVLYLALTGTDQKDSVA